MVPFRAALGSGQDRWGFNGASASELARLVGTHVRDVFGGRVMYRRYLDSYPGAAQGMSPQEPDLA